MVNVQTIESFRMLIQVVSENPNNNIISREELLKLFIKFDQLYSVNLSSELIKIKFLIENSKVKLKVFIIFETKINKIFKFKLPVEKEVLKLLSTNLSLISIENLNAYLQLSKKNFNYFLILKF